MGNEDSTPNIELKQSLKDYMLISTNEDKRYGEVQLYQHNMTPELIWFKEVLVDTEQSFKFITNYIKTESHLNGLFITKRACPIDYNSNVCGACTSNRKIALFMDYYERDLEGELYRRAEDMVS
jgi:hypothetical protein